MVRSGYVKSEKIRRIITHTGTTSTTIDKPADLCSVWFTFLFSIWERDISEHYRVVPLVSHPLYRFVIVSVYYRTYRMKSTMLSQKIFGIMSTYSARFEPFSLVQNSSPLSTALGLVNDATRCRCTLSTSIQSMKHEQPTWKAVQQDTAYCDVLHHGLITFYLTHNLL